MVFIRIGSAPFFDVLRRRTAPFAIRPICWIKHRRCRWLNHTEDAETYLLCITFSKITALLLGNIAYVVHHSDLKIGPKFLSFPFFINLAWKFALNLWHLAQFLCVLSQVRFGQFEDRLPPGQPLCRFLCVRVREQRCCRSGIVAMVVSTWWGFEGSIGLSTGKVILQLTSSHRWAMIIETVCITLAFPLGQFES